MENCDFRHYDIKNEELDWIRCNDYVEGVLI